MRAIAARLGISRDTVSRAIASQSPPRYQRVSGPSAFDEFEPLVTAMSRTDYFHDPNAPSPNSIKVAVSAFVQDAHGRILMIHRTDNNLYSIPGGGLEAGETVTEAVVRAVQEESGIDVHVTGLIWFFSSPDHVIAYDDGEVRQKFSICFRADPIGGQPSIYAGGGGQSS